MSAFIAELNRLGEDGWEAVGITPRTHYDRGGGPGGWDSFTFVVLLEAAAAGRRHDAEELKR